MVNKKAQGLQLNTIILIILGIVVLVFLIIGFTLGWTSFKDKVFSLFTSSNVDSIKISCETACLSGNKYDYCTLERDVIFGKGHKLNNAKLRCGVLENERYNDFGFSKCNSITCKTNKEIACEDKELGALVPYIDESTGLTKTEPCP